MTADREIHFRIPDVDYAVGGDDLVALEQELRNISDGAPRLRSAQLLADEMSAAWTHATIEPDGRQKYALLRALNHLTRSGGRRALIALRDTLSDAGDAGWRAYRLSFVDDARADEDFTSYALNYEPGDRLVTPAGELGVLSVEGADPPTLQVQKWAPSLPRQVPAFVFDRESPITFVSIPPHDGVAIADELATYDDDAAHAAAQKILAAMNLPTQSTDIHLNVFERGPVLTAVESLHAQRRLHDDPDRLVRELRRVLPD